MFLSRNTEMRNQKPELLKIMEKNGAALAFFPFCCIPLMMKQSIMEGQQAKPGLLNYHLKRKLQKFKIKKSQANKGQVKERRVFFSDFAA